MFLLLLPILGITFIDILGFSILIPIMPYYVKHFGAPDVVVGLLFGTFSVCQFFAGPIWGNVSDRIGRKAVLIISQAGATVGWAMLAFAPTLGWLFAARIVEGISGGNISVTQAYVADRVEPKDRSKAFAFVGASFSAGFVLGPLMGGLLLERFGYTTPFLLAAGLQVVTLLATIFFLPEQIAEKGEKGETATFGDIFRMFGEPQISPVLLQKLAFSLGLYAWFGVFALMLQALLGWGPTTTSYFFASFGVASVIFQLFVVGRVTDRFGVRAACNAGFFIVTLFFLLIPVAHDVLRIALISPLFALGMALANATLPALLTDAAPDHVRGTVLGVGSSLDAVAGSVMPIASTSVLGAYGPSWTAAIPAFFTFVALSLGLAAQRRKATPIDEAA